MDKLLKLFRPTYAIYCLQGSSWGSATLGTKKEIVELYKWYAEQQDIEEDGITGDELAKELGSKLSDLFGKN